MELLSYASPLHSTSPAPVILYPDVWIRGLLAANPERPSLLAGGMVFVGNADLDHALELLRDVDAVYRK
jgi:hypothetical protein